jgi:hypothetical protein
VSFVTLICPQTCLLARNLSHHHLPSQHINTYLVCHPCRSPAADLPPGTLPPQQHRNKLRKMGERTSSSNWTNDRLTWKEDIAYKKELGFL